MASKANKLKSAAAKEKKHEPVEPVEPPRKLTRKEKKRLRIQARLALKERLIRERLLREIELVKKSLKRGKPLWEQICGEVKLQEFREEIEAWGEETGRLMDKKDEKIETLMNVLKENQEIQERNFSKYIDQFDYLTQCLQTFRGAATAVYDSSALELVEDFLWDSTNITEIRDRMNENAENIMHSTNVVAKDRLRQNYELYMKRKFSKVCTEVEKRYIMRDATVEKMRALQDKLTLWMTVLAGDMVDVHKTEKFLHFMERQRNYVVESNKLNEVEKMCRKTITDCQNTLLAIESESNRKLYGLKLQQSYFFDVRSVITNSIVRHKQVTHEKVIAVASESYDVLKKLKDFVKQGELLLSLAACCRKYKTEEEKVLPWAEDFDPADSDLNGFLFKMQFDIVKFLDITEEELSEQMHMMKNFWYRCSKVQVHNILLLQEKHRLNEENEKYRNIIRSLKKSDDVSYILESLGVKQIL